MSLQLAAKHLAAHGRGPDNTLVHMTPKEVESLQALAMRHGGSLTINPQTGLPEAGFLSSILPLVAGVGLAAMGMPAGMAALTVGGGTALATGDLGKGLMAGLGAYGGSGLAESLIGSGAAGLAPEAAAAAANAVPTETAAQIASVNQAGLTMPSAVEPSISASLPSANAADPFRLGSSVSQETLKAPVGGITSQSLNYTSPITTTPSPYSNASNATADGPMAKYGPSVSESTYPVQPPSVENMTAGQRFDALKAGATGQNLLNYAKANPLQTAGMVAGPLMAASEDNNAPSTPVGDSDRGAMANAGYEFDPGWANPTPAPDPFGREQKYGNPRYVIPKKAKAADGGAVQHFDSGGAVGGVNQTPALNKFLELQAARAAAPTTAPIDAKQQFADYLKAQSRPVASTVYAPPVIERLPTTPAVEPTTAPEDFTQQHGGGGGGGGGNYGGGGGNYGGGFPAGLAPAANSIAQALGDMGLNSLSHALSNAAMSGAMSGSGAAAGSSTGPAVGTVNGGESGGWGSRDAGGGDGGAGSPGGGDGGGPGGGDGGGGGPGGGGGGDGGGGGPGGGGGGGDGGGGGGGGGGAKGGYLEHGRFSQHPSYAYGGGIAALAQGGMYNLGSYSDGGRLLRGPGDGVSDSIPAVIGRKQPARLADGEFVIPARIVSEIGNGSTEAGARKLYAMMDKVQSARGKTVGKGRVAKNTRADRYLPA